MGSRNPIPQQRQAFFVSCKILKTLIFIATLLFVSSFCSTRNFKTNDNLESFSIPKDSIAFYFKTKPNWQDTTQNAVDSFTNSWFSKNLFALKEPILKDYNGDNEIYRFTWLRTFNHPVSVRIERHQNTYRLTSKVCNGASGFDPGKLIYDTSISLTQNQFEKTILFLNNSDFWNLKTEDNEHSGKDGSEWIVEAYKNKEYKMVYRWTPEKGTKFREIGVYLFSISQIKNEFKGRANGDY